MLIPGFCSAAEQPWSLALFFDAVHYTMTMNFPLKYNESPWRENMTEVALRRKLLSRCRGLLEYQIYKVQFLHLSVKDFLAITDSLDHVRHKLGFKSTDNGHSFLTAFLSANFVHRLGPSLLLQEEPIGKHDPHREIFHQAKMTETTTHKSPTDALNALRSFIDANDLIFCFMYRGRLRPSKDQDFPNHLKPDFDTLAVQAGLILYVGRALIEKLHHQQLRVWGLLYFAIWPVIDGCVGDLVINPDMVKMLVPHTNVKEKCAGRSFL